MIFIDFFGALFETIPMLLITLQLLNKFHFSKIQILYLFSISLGTAIFLTLSLSYPFIKLPLAVVILAIFISKLYKVKFTFSILSLLLSMTLLLIVQLINIIIFDLLFAGSSTFNQIRFISGLVNGSLLTLLLLFLRAFRRSLIPNQDISQAKPPKFWWIFPLCVVLFMLIVIKVIQDDGISITSAYLIITSSIAFIYLTRYLVYLNTIKAEKKLLTEQEKSAKFYLRSIRAQRHDFIFQLNTINSLVHLNRINDLKAYLSELTEEFQTTSETLPLHYMSIAGLLIQYKQVLKKDGINFNIFISDTFELIPMPVYEFNNVIGNLISNAYEFIKSNETASREIVIKFYKNQYLIVEVLNEVNPELLDLENIFQDGYSTKTTYENGLGLSNIMMTLERYNGYIYPELNNRTLSMFVLIPPKERK
ncbi:GHKL domain-containing protein [Niallia sp. FSL W8-0954]|uniref:GHKL domain-containing protein n=1 Tax=Niallia sp. FSL W8-0954 TaxID=2975338 RepID=UPI0013D65E3F